MDTHYVANGRPASSSDAIIELNKLHGTFHNSDQVGQSMFRSCREASEVGSVLGISAEKSSRTVLHYSSRKTQFTSPRCGDVSK
ncbi:uncharacterized protein N7500_008542 [Penicillium coprophilum]|uniref:uncharacterized protein n=1 Tax=Penicillium coprophilum TaxID=36646 RepID=UPI002392144F|nr:uncharacterized protein N7500_008542 [Penicillium coprophilum]KAJ5158891.1 hypothetical protein N7500_008542 [Penicillium coprophilum]